MYKKIILLVIVVGGLHAMDQSLQQKALAIHEEAKQNGLQVIELKRLPRYTEHIIPLYLNITPHLYYKHFCTQVCGQDAVLDLEKLKEHFANCPTPPCNVAHTCFQKDYEIVITFRSNNNEYMSFGKKERPAPGKPVIFFENVDKAQISHITNPKQ